MASGRVERGEQADRREHADARVGRPPPPRRDHADDGGEAGEQDQRADDERGLVGRAEHGDGPVLHAGRHPVDHRLPHRHDRVLGTVHEAGHQLGDPQGHGRGQHARPGPLAERWPSPPSPPAGLGAVVRRERRLLAHHHATLTTCSPPGLVELALDGPDVGPRAGRAHGGPAAGPSVDLDHPTERRVSVGGLGQRATERAGGHRWQPYRRQARSLRRPTTPTVIAESGLTSAAARLPFVAMDLPCPPRSGPVP